MAFPLRYDGMKFDTPENKPVENKEDKKKEPAVGQEKVEKFGHTFSNIGALVMRYQLGQKHRAALLQEVALENYAQRPIQKPAPGKDQPDLFSPDAKASNTVKQTGDLLKYAHATLGRGKVFNERRQPQREKNITSIGGEALVWDVIHQVVWSVGMSFAGQLKKQGFVYVAAPANISPKKHKEITEALRNHDFKIVDGEVHVLGEVLPTIAPGSLKIEFDANKKKTFQDNGFLISSSESTAKSPMGWIMNVEQEKVLEPDIAEDCLRIIKVGTTHFHQLTPSEQQLLMGGRLTQSAQTTITQNALFNGLYAICIDLNKNFNFDPEKLLGNQLEAASKRLTMHFENPEHLDDFLTGIILTEMTQPLQVSQETTQRKIPVNYKVPFADTLNNAKAFAYAFDIHDSKHQSILIPDAQAQTTLSEDPNLIDISVNGKLALPALSSGKHAGAVLSTAILVAEQLFMEQLLREAIKNKTVEELLMDIMDNNSPEIIQIANEFNNMAKDCEWDLEGPILGLQYAYCEPMVKMLRKVLGTEHLIKLADSLENINKTTEEILVDFKEKYGDIEPDQVSYDVQPKTIEEGLENLYRLGHRLQKNPTTDASSENSRGINAGLAPLILKMTPELGRKLELSLEEGDYQVPDYKVIDQGKESEVKPGTVKQREAKQSFLDIIRRMFKSNT